MLGWLFGRRARVDPNHTAMLLYGRFREHLEHVLDHWNEMFGENPGHYLSDDQIEGLKSILGDYFEKWFSAKFPPLGRGEKKGDE